MKAFELVSPRSVGDAVALLAGKPGAGVLAGGTDLLGLQKDRVQGPSLPLPGVLVNLKRVPALRGIVKEGERIVLGALTTLSQLADDPLLRSRFTAVAEAAAEVGSPQLRNMGTLGGNLCQRPRCAYFRHRQFVCLKKGGDRCHAAEGEHRYYHAIFRGGPCHMVHPSDLAPALQAFDATVRVAGPPGERELPLARFFRHPEEDPLREVALDPGELVTAVLLPEPPPGTCSAFTKARVRQGWQFALASVAVAITLEQGECRQARVILGGVAPTPYRAAGAETVLEGVQPDERVLARAADAAVEAARPLRDNAYKIDLTRGLVRQALGRALGVPPA
ncbi:MAG: xanthine dehydrogenase family protein subunit M [Deltaproteobacteria bacterium]|nr:xanthine dehydrogenase family protein subunit M [Deltaproteobacteria bacterium]